MRIGATFSDNPPRAATIGFFDGVHLGHRCLINQVREAASVRGLETAVVTFPVHPARLIRPDYGLRLLTTCGEKTALLAATGIDTCILLDFTPRLAALSAREFMAILRQRYHIEVLVIGYDHRFGHDRREGFDDYVRHGRGLGMEVLPAHAFYRRQEGSGTEVAASSSLIRRLLAVGDVAEAAQWLGYEYFLRGTVVAGHHVGHTLGFPTANLRPGSPDKLVPADGVYAVRVEVEGEKHGGMLCIGTRPTLDNGAERSIEVNIFDFHADIYGRPLRLSFVRRTRGEQKFGSTDALVRQLRQDEREVRGILAEPAMPARHRPD